MALKLRLGDFLCSFLAKDNCGSINSSSLGAIRAGLIALREEEGPQQRSFLLTSSDFPPLPNQPPPSLSRRESCSSYKQTSRKVRRRGGKRKVRSGRKKQRSAPKASPTVAATPGAGVPSTSPFIFLKLSLSPQAAPVACIPKAPGSPVPTTASRSRTDISFAKPGPVSSPFLPSVETPSSALEAVSASSYLHAVLSTASKAVRSVLRGAAGSLGSLCTWVRSFGFYKQRLTPDALQQGRSIQTSLPAPLPKQSKD